MLSFGFFVVIVQYVTAVNKFKDTLYLSTHMFNFPNTSFFKKLCVLAANVCWQNIYIFSFFSISATTPSDSFLTIYDLQKTCGQLEQQYSSPSWPLERWVFFRAGCVPKSDINSYQKNRLTSNLSNIQPPRQVANCVHDSSLEVFAFFDAGDSVDAVWFFGRSAAALFVYNT